jgi:hypothetical protein
MFIQNSGNILRYAKIKAEIGFAHFSSCLQMWLSKDEIP